MAGSLHLVQDTLAMSEFQIKQAKLATRPANAAKPPVDSSLPVHDASLSGVSRLAPVFPLSSTAQLSGDDLSLSSEYYRKRLAERKVKMRSDQWSEGGASLVDPLSATNYALDLSVPPAANTAEEFLAQQRQRTLETTLLGSASGISKPAAIMAIQSHVLPRPAPTTSTLAAVHEPIIERAFTLDAGDSRVGTSSRLQTLSAALPEQKSRKYGPESRARLSHAAGLDPHREPEAVSSGKPTSAIDTLSVVDRFRWRESKRQVADYLIEAEVQDSLQRLRQMQEKVTTLAKRRQEDTQRIRSAAMKRIEERERQEAIARAEMMERIEREQKEYEAQVAAEREREREREETKQREAAEAALRRQQQQREEQMRVLQQHQEAALKVEAEKREQERKVRDQRAQERLLAMAAPALTLNTQLGDVNVSVQVPSMQSAQPSQRVSGTAPQTVYSASILPTAFVAVSHVTSEPVQPRSSIQPVQPDSELQQSAAVQPVVNQAASPTADIALPVQPAVQVSEPPPRSLFEPLTPQIRDAPESKVQTEQTDQKSTHRELDQQPPQQQEPPPSLFDETPVQLDDDGKGKSVDAQLDDGKAAAAVDAVSAQPQESKRSPSSRAGEPNAVSLVPSRAAVDALSPTPEAEPASDRDINTPASTTSITSLSPLPIEQIDKSPNASPLANTATAANAGVEAKAALPSMPTRSSTISAPSPSPSPSPASTTQSMTATGSGSSTARDRRPFGFGRFQPKAVRSSFMQQQQRITAKAPIVSFKPSISPSSSTSSLSIALTPQQRQQPSTSLSLASPDSSSLSVSPTTPENTAASSTPSGSSTATTSTVKPAATAATSSSGSTATNASWDSDLGLDVIEL